jgi:hypothetical protein
MLYNTQSNPRWAYDAMGLPTDYMKDWGCLVTAISNIYDILPGDLNKWLRENGGYYGKGYLNQESFLKWDVIEKHLNFKHISGFNSEFILDEKHFYIARILHRKYKTGHYCNMFDFEDRYGIFDTDYGDAKMYTKDQVKDIIQITKGA